MKFAPRSKLNRTKNSAEMTHERVQKSKGARQKKTPAMGRRAMIAKSKKDNQLREFSPAAAAASAAAVMLAASALLTKSFNSLLGLKKGIRLAGTSTFSPVFGLRPVRPR